MIVAFKLASLRSLNHCVGDDSKIASSGVKPDNENSNEVFSFRKFEHDVVEKHGNSYPT